MNNLGNPLANPYENTPPHPINNSSLDNPLSSSGRFTRLSFLAWNFILAMSFSCIFTILMFIGLVGFSISTMQDPANLFSHPLTIISILLGVLLYIAFMASFIIICIRRLHDMNKSGWLVLLIFIPLVGIIFSIYIFAARGTVGSNAYGAFRPTEQAEKFLGYLYLVFMAIFLIFYVAILSVVMSKPEIFQQIPGMMGAETTTNTEYSYDDNENNVPLAPPSTENAQSEQPLTQINRQAAPQIAVVQEAQTAINTGTEEAQVQHAEVDAQQMQRSADDAVRDAQAAAEAAVNASSSQ